MESTERSWLEKPAISWTFSHNNASSIYWNEGLLQSMERLSGRTWSAPQKDQHRCISYDSLLVMAVLLVRRLGLLFPEINDKKKNTLGVTVVVAIPEGPLLALAVLVVHLLNTSHQAILIPLEPNEGQERLGHMLKDSRPLFVLCLKGSDCDNIARVLQSIEEEEEETTATTADSTTNRITAPSQLLDFEDLIQKCLDEDSNQPEQSAGLRNKLAKHASGSFFDTAETLLLLPSSLDEASPNRVSHIVYTSGTTGVPKGCVSSFRSLRSYLTAKNEAHGIDGTSTVLLASALSFDPCLSDVLATLQAKATLAMATRHDLLHNLPSVLMASSSSSLRVAAPISHMLCTPTLWGTVHSAGRKPEDFPNLRVVALGGEPIPQRIVSTWAHRRPPPTPVDEAQTRESSALRLFATYGVTEACVYQTMGEVFSQDSRPTEGQKVGKAFSGMQYRICKEGITTTEMVVVNNGDAGEIVLLGAQLDECSGYLNKKELTQKRFKLIKVDDGEPRYTYWTGDRGRIDPQSGELVMLGRIDGEDGMVKVNGVRVELGEVESALIDPGNSRDEPPVVVDSVAIVQSMEADASSKQIHAYLVLGERCKEELQVRFGDGIKGIMCGQGPLYALLRARCQSRLRKGVMPAAFVLIPRIPLSPTGKCDRRQLPQLSQCSSSLLSVGGNGAMPLSQYGLAGAALADTIVECLNLQSCQESLLTTETYFAAMGGDSLAATRVVRALYSIHHGVYNSRLLGGSFGGLDGPFAVIHLLRATTLSEYVDFLDGHGVCSKKNVPTSQEGAPHKASMTSSTPSEEYRSYEALVEATTLGQSTVAIGLLNAGVDPNLDAHGGRLGKVSGRIARRKQFKSNPLHLACGKGMASLVRKLLDKGCKFNAPDASGIFPLHLATCGTTTTTNNNNSVADDKDDDESRSREDAERLECVKLLLDAGAPLAMRDGNRQTVLHGAARSGHAETLRYLARTWRDMLEPNKSSTEVGPTKGYGKLDWMDSWFRTPVHWAVLNGKVRALQVLMEEGFDPDPRKPKKPGRRTSVAIESPMEICTRVYKESDEIGTQIRKLLLSA